MYLQRLYFRDCVEKSMLLKRLKLWYNFKAAATYIADNVQMILWVYFKKKSLCEISPCKVQPPLPGEYIHKHTHISVQPDKHWHHLGRAGSRD